MGNYGKTNISTEQSPEGEKARFSGADENQVRAQRDQAPASERPQKVNGVSLLDLRLPKENRLRKPAEFRRVYEYGTRIEGRFMTVFIMPSKTSFQRLGITASKKAIEMVQAIAAEAEIGKIYRGTVRKIVEFGAFVEIMPGTDGLLHISQIAAERINKVTDVLKEGEEVMVKVLEVDKQGKIRLSRKEAMAEMGGASEGGRR